MQIFVIWAIYYGDTSLYHHNKRRGETKIPQQNMITFTYQSYSKGEKAMSHYEQTKKYDAENSRYNY